MTALWLSRVRLRRDDAHVAALARLLVPEDGAARVAAGHHLIWSLFSDRVDRVRDFLWREERPGHFLTLSARAPVEQDLFAVETKPFAPVLSRGDRLGFALRANPVVARSAGSDRRGRRHDVVMDALHAASPGTRAAQRAELQKAAGQAWLVRQGQTHGFVPEDDMAVLGYDRVRIPRPGGGDAVFGVMDLTGALRVEDPARFTTALAIGFGRGRAFGYGLMLIRRSPPRIGMSDA